MFCEVIQNVGQFIVNMIFFGMIDFVVVMALGLAYDCHKRKREDEDDAEETD